MAGGLNSKRRKRSIEGNASLAGLAVHWVLISEPQWSNSGSGYKGLCISVKVLAEARRELVIEFPYPKGRNGRPLPVPQRPQISAKLVEAKIQDAMANGWDPTSRGRTFVYYVPDDG